MPDPTSTNPTEIQAEHVAKSFGEQVVLKSIDLTVRSGEIACIVGASGSGKTVLLDNLIGLMRPDSGRVLAADHNAASQGGPPPLRNLAELSDDQLDLIRLHWAVVFQRNALFSGSVRENIAFWLREHTTLDEGAIEKRARDSLAAVALDVDDVIDKDRDKLSGGMAKRVAIARAIACDPILMFYDEPTTGLDPMIGATIHELIFKTHNSPAGEGFKFRDLPQADQSARASVKRTTIIVTHDRELLRRIRPRVVLLDQGGICFDGSYDEFEKADCPPAQAYLKDMPVLHSREVRSEPWRGVFRTQSRR